MPGKIILNEEAEGFKQLNDEWRNRAKECNSMEEFQQLYHDIFEECEHDYGTICHAITAMCRAALHMCNHSPHFLSSQRHHVDVHIRRIHAE